MAKKVDDEERLARYFDASGRLTLFPSKRRLKDLVLGKLIQEFDRGTRYAEIEVNRILNEFHTFGDHVLLRRELIDSRLLKREKDGSAYWRPAES